MRECTKKKRVGVLIMKLCVTRTLFVPHFKYKIKNPFSERASSLLSIIMYTGISILVGYLCLIPIISNYTDGSIKSILYYSHALGVSCIIFLLLNNNNAEEATTTDKNEIYGLRHLLFNLELPPKTLWFNMGLWDKPGLTFPQACENLVHAVATVMKIQPASTVLGM
jgi:hypothetical protein